MKNIEVVVVATANQGKIKEIRDIMQTTRLPDGLPVGQAVATPGFDLPTT